MAAKSFAVIGLGKFGRSIAYELAAGGAQVLGIDTNEELVDEAAEYIDCAVKADVCDAGTMATLGLSNMDGVVVAITGSLNASIMGTILAKEAGVPYILCKSQDEIHTRILEKVGATKIVVPEKETGVRYARSMISGGFIDLFELSDRIRMVEMKPKSDWVGHTLRELNLPRREKINVVAIRRDGELTVGPDPDKPLARDITMIITADRRQLSKLMDD